MFLDVNDQLFAILTAHQHARANSSAADGLGEEAVWLHTDIGPSYYLTRSGRVLVTDAFHADAGPREASADEAVAALVLGARNLAAPQLLELLPARPARARECDRCRGARWWTLPARDVKGDEMTVICPVCSGKGWTG